uniref:Uncharacterized protein n=1 Tax=Candidatus Kentrum sp. SD TaxID=2126332 RepID=A0A451BS70_9GAMM|nr:MAG: hypothetical protein BECKSD772D_GA0070982_12302 [Candidatus Kentron sp. SD]
MEDQLIKEIRTIKDRLASKYNYDLRAMYSDIAQKQRASNRKIVNLSSKTESQPGSTWVGMRNKPQHSRPKHGAVRVDVGVRRLAPTALIIAGSNKDKPDEY